MGCHWQCLPVFLQPSSRDSLLPPSLSLLPTFWPFSIRASPSSHNSTGPVFPILLTLPPTCLDGDIAKTLFVVEREKEGGGRKG